MPFVALSLALSAFLPYGAYARVCPDLAEWPTNRHTRFPSATQHRQTEIRLWQRVTRSTLQGPFPPKAHPSDTGNALDHGNRLNELTRETPEWICGEGHPLLADLFCKLLKDHAGHHATEIENEQGTEMTLEWSREAQHHQNS